MVSPNRIKNEAKNLVIFVSPKAKQLSQVIEQSKKIICRSGYSTLMDLQKLQIEFKNVILVPTPSQTEQEYLTNYSKNKFGCTSVLQVNLKNYEF
jgi:UDP-N-acetylglucosamine:LPS N-acetylglucosamine transferase